MGWAHVTHEGDGVLAGFWLESQKEDPGVERKIILKRTIKK
jgi:hypothetical protein